MSKLFFTFKPPVESQRELIHEWLQQDYISEWIHGQGLQNTLAGLERFFQYQAEGKKFDRETKVMQHWVGYNGDKPFVYLLTSNVFKQNEDEEYAKYSAAEGLAITLDIFICDRTYLGKGLAMDVIRQFLLSHFSDVAEVFIDPEKRNERAVHVYQKVGFRIVGEFIAAWHPVPHHVMRLNMKDLLLN
ncbi:MAG TPA: GNAT family N-acetyltransferase [Gammaproteobacteria bacterium]|jgi:RimJ/RimL family protein N-acetyltransferase|nr:GNAT family N-acetyltransferase [Gammaproteobacteria bacterium]